MSVSGFPVFPFIVSSIERIRIVQIMYGSYYLVEAMRGKVFADLFAAAFLHAYFYSFEYPERISFRSPEGMELRIYPVCFLLLGFHIENLGCQILMHGLHRRYEKIAVVSKTDAGKSFFKGRQGRFPYACPFPVKRKLTVVVIVEKLHVR